MASSVTAFQLYTFFNVTENTNSAPTGVGAPIVFQEMNQSLNPTVAYFAIYRQSLGSTLSPDFTAAQGTNGTINASGMRLMAICVVNPSTSTADVNIAAGAANPYALPQPITVK